MYEENAVSNAYSAEEIPVNFIIVPNQAFPDGDEPANYGPPPRGLRRPRGISPAPAVDQVQEYGFGGHRLNFTWRSLMVRTGGTGCWELLLYCEMHSKATEIAIINERVHTPHMSLSASCFPCQ